MLCTQLDPSCTEAEEELARFPDMSTYKEPIWEHDPIKLEFPDPDEVKDGVKSGDETEVLSDTSDYEHDGNGVPCRHYNHDGCQAGPDCKFTHAPDGCSLRDKL